MALTINWDQVSSLARNKHVARIRDNFFLDNPLLKRMQGRIKPWDGGPVLVVPLSFAPEGGGGGWYSGTDKFDTRVRNPITAANYTPKNAHVPIAIDVDEELAVRGEPALLNLVDAKMTIAESTIRALISQDLYNNATNPKAIGGLQLALRHDIVASSYSYGGITAGGSAPSVDTNGWWQHNADVTGYTAGGGGGTFMHAADGQNPVSKMWGNIALRSSKQPSLIISNWGCWTDYHNSLFKTETREKQLPQRDKELAQAGFTNLMYRSAPWVADARAPRVSGVEKVYLIDETAVSLYVHPARDFAFENWRKPVDQDAKIAYLFWRGELCFSERRSSGIINAVTVPAAVL
jgi:hypothetical protein